jgi:hypothetical protein
MQCPFLEEVVMRYCRAYPVRKMIPASSSQLVSPCFTNYETCPVFKGKEHPAIKVPRPEEKIAGTTVPETGPVPPEQKQQGEQKYCVWLRQDVVSYRLCTRNYDCKNCPFEQQMLDEGNGKYVESPEVIREIERLRKLPGPQRKCKYMVTGYQPCTLNYECWRCPIYQRIREAAVTTYINEAREQPADNRH